MRSSRININVRKERADGSGYWAEDEMISEQRPHTMSGLAHALGISRQTLLDYGDREEFMDTIEDAKEKVHRFAEEQLFGKSSSGAAWDEMRRSDASVGVSLRAVMLPIKSSKFFTTPASDDDLDVEISDLASWNLFERIKRKKTLGEILTHLEFGFAVFEIVFEPELANGTWRIVLTKLAYRKPTTIESWQCEDGSPGITQCLSNGKLVSIPLERLLVFTNEHEGDNYEGRSILRTAHKHWF